MSHYPHRSEPSPTDSTESPAQKRTALYQQLRELPDNDESEAARTAIWEAAESFYRPFQEKVLPLANERLDAAGSETKGRLAGRGGGELVTALVFEAADGYLDKVTPSMIDQVIADLDREG